MPLCKVTNSFSQVGRGWTETFHFEAADAGAALTMMYGLRTQRSKCLSRDTIWSTIRAEQIEGVNQGVLSTSAHIDTEKYDAAGDVTASGVLIKMLANTGHSRGYIMRGVPDSWIIRSTVSEDLVLVDVARNNIDYFCSALLALGTLRLYSRPKRKAPGATWPLVDAVPVALKPKTTEIIHTMPFETTPPAGEFIQIGGCRNQARLLNRVWRVLKKSGEAHVDIGLVFNRILGFRKKDVIKGFIRPYTRVAVAVNKMIRFDVRTRQSGEVQGETAGAVRR